MAWQIQRADGELNDVVARSIEDGPQTIVREGTEVAVVMSIGDFRKLTSEHEATANLECAGSKQDLRDFLLSRDGPFFDDLAIELERIEQERIDNLFRDVEL
ncbi:MAG TPA: type II toxin-antitoxin system prevent-host-death family antitoxin [Thermomicrobiales bacterium]|nr:type II toxin-antitoxin system prevent-host-death family antitoxin [Thermomicrobiales bacterium]